MIQALLDATPAGQVCTLPGGTIDVLENTPIIVRRAVTIDGNGTTIRVVNTAGERSTVMPTVPLFNFAAVPDGSDVTVRDLTIVGPDCTAWPTSWAPSTAALDWTQARTWNSSFTIDGVTVTGGYCYAVQRAGGGRFRIFNSSLTGFVGAFSFFESHGGWGDLTVRDTILAAQPNQKHTSIGAYIHPHLNVTWERVAASGWRRYACYLNGTPQSAGHHTFVEVTATDCALIQTGSSSETTLIRCVEQGTPANGGSFFKGPVVSIGSTWAAKGLIGLMGNNAVTRRFVQDTIRPNNTWLAAGNGSSGRVLLYGCTVELDSRDCLLSSNPTSTVEVEVVSTTVTVAGPPVGYSINVTGGSIRFIDSDVFPNVRVVPPGVLA